MFISRTDSEAETPILWPPDVKSWLIWKDPDAGKDWGQEEKGTTEDEMAGWHHWLDGRESEWTLGVGDGQGGLACCGSMWLQRVGHDLATELNWTLDISYISRVTIFSQDEYQEHQYESAFKNLSKWPLFSISFPIYFPITFPQFVIPWSSNLLSVVKKGI